MPVVRRRRVLITVVLAAVVAAAASACQPGMLPIGARAAGNEVEAFVGSCSGASVDVQLLETDVPVPTTVPFAARTAPGSSGGGSSTPPGSYWTPGVSVWWGTLPAGDPSVVIPIALDPTHTYTITAVGGPDDPTFADYTFVPADLSEAGVTSYRSRNGVASPEEFAEDFDGACDAAAGGILRWIFYAGIVVVFLVLAGFGLTVGLLIKAATEHRRRPPPPSPWAA